MISLCKRFKAVKEPISRLLLGAAFLWLGCGSTAFASGAGLVCFKDICFHAEIARTQAEKQHGLMERTQLAPGQGMLFVYDREVRPDFWMKNMRIPLDFIWLDAGGRTVGVDKNIPVCSGEVCPPLRSPALIRYVLEVPAGTVQKTKIEIGDQAVIKLGENNAD